MAIRYRNLFTTPDGEKVLDHMMRLNGIDRPFPDLNQAAYWEGRRAAILDVLAWLNLGLKANRMGVYDEVKRVAMAKEHQLYAEAAKEDYEDEI